MAKPVVAALMGGLGNQLFQYAAGRALAKARGAELLLDVSPLAHPATLRRYMLDAYAIRAALFPFPLRIRRSGAVATAFPTGRDFRRGPVAAVRRLLSEHGRRELPVVTEESFRPDTATAASDAGAYLAGYWQSERYFQAIAAELRETFRRPREVDARNAAWLARIAATDAVCVHVRRGDYLQPDIAAVYGVCSPDYYRRALALVRERVADATAFVFSDDPAWARTNLDGVVVDANGPSQAPQELMLMAACRHHVIANSSLSWWAAWLAASTDQIVVAPDPWFADGGETPDLLPARWTKLPRA
jgi:hypothetical protein